MLVGEIATMADQQRGNQRVFIGIGECVMNLPGNLLVPGVVPAMPTAMKVVARCDCSNTSGRPVPFPEQPILVTEALLVQVSVRSFENHLKPQPMAGKCLIIPAIPGKANPAG